MGGPLERDRFRLLPSERVLWHGTPTAGVPRDQIYRLGPALLGTLAAVFMLFAGLFAVADLPGAQQSALGACYLAVMAAALHLSPLFLRDSCEYVVTDRRILWARGKLRRSIDRDAVTFARIRWHRSEPRVGHLELVRAVPFGPLARRQRLVLHDLAAPDTLLALIRGADPAEHGGASDVPLIDRLDPDEVVLWGGHPEGWLVGVREVATALLGLGVVAAALRYGVVVLAVLLGLEDVGFSVRSWAWMLLFFATGITWSMMISIGIGLVWHGFGRARAMGHATEYLLTNRRILIRRGGVELSVDRHRIVDVAETSAGGGLRNLFLVLDAPESRALADSGALSTWMPPRDAVAPILYELRDADLLKRLLFERDSRPTIRDAA